MIALLTIMASIVTVILASAINALNKLNKAQAQREAWIKAENAKREQAARDHAAQVAIWEMSGLKLTEAELLVEYQVAVREVPADFLPLGLASPNGPALDGNRLNDGLVTEVHVKTLCHERRSCRVEKGCIRLC